MCNIDRTITFRLDGKHMTRRLVNRQIEDYQTELNAACTIGQLLTNASVGEVLLADVPGGESLQLEVIEIGE